MQENGEDICIRQLQSSPCFGRMVYIGLSISVKKLHNGVNGMNKIAGKFFLILSLCVAIGISGYIVIGDRINQNNTQSANLWNDYANVDAFIRQSENPGAYSVMVNDPPAYQIATNQKAYILPYGTIDTLLKTADDFKVDYLVLDKNHIQNYNELYDNPVTMNGLTYLGNIMDYRIFKFGKK